MLDRTQRYYMGWPILPRGLLVVGEVDPNTPGHCLSPTPFGTVGHNLWRLFVGGNKLDCFDTFSRTDYLYACEIIGLCQGDKWDEGEAFRRAHLVMNWQGPCLILGGRAWRAVMPTHRLIAGAPASVGRFYCVNYPLQNAEMYQNKDVFFDNARIAARALCAGFEWAAQIQGYPYHLATDEELVT